MSAMKFFGQGIDKESTCSTNFDQFTRCYNDGAAQTYGTFVLAFNLEGLHDSDDEFRSCIPLDGNTTALNFTTGIPSIGGTTTSNSYIIKHSTFVVAPAADAIPVVKFNAVVFPSNGIQLLNSSSESCKPSKLNANTNDPFVWAVPLN